MTTLLLGLPVFTWLLALALRRFGTRLPDWARLLASSYPVLWTFVVALATTHLFTERVPMGKGTTFAAMALSSAAFVALVPALFTARLRGLVAGLVVLALSGLAFADLVYFRYFSNIIPLLVPGNASMLWDVRASILALIDPADAWLLPSTVGALALVLAWPRTKTPSTSRRPKLAWALHVSLVLTCVGGSVPAAMNVTAWMNHRYSWKVFRMADSIHAGGIVLAHVRDVARTLRERMIAEEASPEKLEALESFLERRAIEATSNGIDFGLAKGMNLLLIQVEALQQWTLGAKVDDQELTPFLSSLRERALYFPNVFDQTGESPTSDCEYAVMNSQHPLQRGAIPFRRVDNGFVTTAQAFQEAGYSTFSAHAYEQGMWNRAILHPRYGFSRSYFSDDFKSGRRLGWGLADHLFFQQMTPVIAKEKEPYLAYLITLSSHHPYKFIPRDLRQLKLGPLEATEFGGYLHSVHYVDRSLETFLGNLERQGALENTVVAIYGDHESKLRFVGKTREDANRLLEIEEGTVDQIARRDWFTDRIPFLIVFPDGRRRGRVETVGGQVDLGPTLLHYFGLPRPGSFLGRALLPGVEHEAVRLDGSVASSDRLLFVEGKDACKSRIDGASLPLESCGDLRAHAAEELDYSWLVTLQDLAQRMRDEGPRTPGLHAAVQ